jgi:hypothetical protein
VSIRNEKGVVRLWSFEISIGPRHSFTAHAYADDSAEIVERSGPFLRSHRAWWSYVSTDECSVSSLECSTIPREALEALADELQRVTGAETRRGYP